MTERRKPTRTEFEATTLPKADRASLSISRVISRER
jgi:hypothetical protein